ncbi:MAG: DUF1272 domain-containing protein [Nitrososphaerota archaeon]|nr:DUF1272 domain-containing protein [Nitrososphaerota archaeon]
MEQTCKNCGAPLTNAAPDAKYCSIECTYSLPNFKREAVFP